MNKMVTGKTIKIPCMRRGLCGYADETVHLPQSTLEKMAKTSHGIPVVIDHQQVNTANVERVTVGRVADMHYDAETDNWDVHFVVDVQEGVDLLQRGWGVSTSYEITSSGAGGTLNNVPFDREVEDARYLHLAIVQNPRYEMAKNPVFYNGKDDQPTGVSKMLFKLFRTKREEIKVNADEELCVEVGGKVVPVAGMLQELTELETPKPSQVMMQADDIVEYNGARVKIGELVERYNKMKNEAEPEKEKEPEGEPEKEKEVEKEKENSAPEAPAPVAEPAPAPAPEAAAPAPEPVKDNVDPQAQARFEEINRAPVAPDAPVEMPMSLRERTTAGLSRYGSGR